MSKCNVCKTVYNEESLLQNNQDEYFCKDCFKRPYPSSTWKSNLGNQLKGDVLIKPKKMFYLSELNILRQKRQRKKNTSYTSKKPLRCPHNDCNKHVSVFDFNTHFLHEHGDVPIIHTVLEARHSTAFYPKDLRYSCTRCLMLLNITKANTSQAVISNWYKSETSVVFLVSRIGMAQLIDGDNCGISDNDSLTSSSSDKIIMWMASNVATDFSYTIAASSVAEDVKVKYCGPVLQFGDSPTQLYSDGHCLMINHVHFMKMTEGGGTFLNLDVKLHGAD